MRVKYPSGQLLPTFSQTVTVLNRRMGQDSPDGLDAWKKTILHGCVWASHVTRSVNGSTVSLGASYIVRIPAMASYRQYPAWCADMQGFTLSVGDIIVQGEMQDTITPDNVRDILQAYPESFAISLIRDNTGPGKPLGHYRVEGV